MIDEPSVVDIAPDDYAYVCVTGPGSLAELTALIGLAPDEGWDRNDFRKNVHSRYGFSNWKLHSGLPRGVATDEHVTRIFRRLEPVAEEFSTLDEPWSKWLVATGHFEDPSFLIGLSFRNHRRAVVLGPGYDFDFCFDGM